jgi:hypothetical protein
MKYIMIVAIVACASFQVLAQQNNKPSLLTVYGSSLQSADPLFIISDDQASREITKEEVEKIDKRNIQSISVLKDDKAREAYGEKGKNGVVVLVMKGDSFSETFPGNSQPIKEK